MFQPTLRETLWEKLKNFYFNSEGQRLIVKLDRRQRKTLKKFGQEDRVKDCISRVNTLPR